ncbi:MAG: hypothetical protein LBR89_01110, partial [Holosporales bacterium]|nr:hypothetical protein [Holosporales bacterium]
MIFRKHSLRRRKGIILLDFLILRVLCLVALFFTVSPANAGSSASKDWVARAKLFNEYINRLFSARTELRYTRGENAGELVSEEHAQQYTNVQNNAESGSARLRIQALSGNIVSLQVLPWNNIRKVMYLSEDRKSVKFNLPAEYDCDYSRALLAAKAVECINRSNQVKNNQEARSVNNVQIKVGDVTWRQEQKIPGNVPIGNDGGVLVSYQEVENTPSDELNILSDLCSQYVKQKMFRNKNVQVVNLEDIEQREIYSTFMSPVSSVVFPTILAETFNAPSYEAHLASLNLSERVAFLFSCGTVNFPPQGNTATDEARKAFPKRWWGTSASVDDWIDFVHVCNDSVALTRQLKAENRGPTTTKEFVHVGIAHVLEHGGTNASIARATECFGKAWNNIEHRETDANDFRTGCWPDRVTSLHAFCLVESVQSLSVDELCSLPTYRLRTLWPKFECIGCCANLCRYNEFSLGMTLLGYISGTKCEVRDDTRKYLGLLKQDFFRAKLANASKQGDLAFVQRFVDMGVRFGSLDLVAACGYVSEQAATFLVEFNELNRAPNEPPSPDAYVKDQLKSGISQMRVPAWPVSGDLKRLITDPTFQMFMVQRFAPERNVRYPIAVRGLNNM